MLDLLVERGFVERRGSLDDRRIKMVRLCEAGRTELYKLVVLAGRSERRVTAGLTAADKAELRRLLGIVYGNVAAEPEDAPARIR